MGRKARSTLAQSQWLESQKISGGGRSVFLDFSFYRTSQDLARSGCSVFSGSSLKRFSGTGVGDQELVVGELAAALVKTDGCLIVYARYYWLLAEGHLTRQPFGSMLRSIAALPSPAGKGSRRSKPISVSRKTGTGKGCEEKRHCLALGLCRARRKGFALKNLAGAVA
jgi:hypothetical protein